MSLGCTFWGQTFSLGLCVLHVQGSTCSTMTVGRRHLSKGSPTWASECGFLAPPEVDPPEMGSTPRACKRHPRPRRIAKKTRRTFVSPDMCSTQKRVQLKCQYGNRFPKAIPCIHIHGFGALIPYWHSSWTLWGIRRSNKARC